ncbi:FtsX-like permease family protein [Kitasatospora sp. NPDC092948]|uniref:FtsX-like permease family protein n=1 Tax=Kitasatospora sp. NPDC092948 TaxID=3364088 RepID=UPI0038025ADD
MSRTDRSAKGRFRLVLAIGHRAGRGRAGSVHRASLFFAALLTFLTAWAAVCSGTVHEQRDRRMTARNPVPVAESEHASAVARWWERPDNVDRRSISVIFVRPLRPDTPPPPGLPRWPAPGEAFLSPALLAADSTTADRYGTLAGTITHEGLADGAELVVYTNPVRPEFFAEVEERTSYIGGFGNPDRVFFFIGSHQFDRSLGDLLILLLLMAGLPCAALVLVAVRSRSESRDRRLAVLDALGAPTGRRALVLAGEAALPLAAGVGTGLALAAALSPTSPTLPFTGYVAWSEDLRAALPLLPPTAAGTLAALLAMVVAAGIRRPVRTGTRPTRVPARPTRWAPPVFAVGLAAAAWGSNARGVEGRAGFFLGAAVALVTLPHTASQVARRLGRVLAERGAARGDAGRLIAGRWLAARPATLARLSAALLVGLGVVTIGQVLTTQFTGPAEQARQRFEQSGATLIQVRSRNIPATAEGFVAAVGPSRTLRYAPLPDSTNNSPLLSVTGRCEALAELGRLRACPAEPVAPKEAFESLTPLGRTVLLSDELVSAPVETVCGCADPATGGDLALYGFLILNRDGEPGVSAIERAAYTHLIGPMTSRPGQSWFLGTVAQAAQIRWLPDVALLGLLSLALAGSLGAAGIFLEQAEALGPLASYRADARFYRGIAFWNLALPLGCVGIAGAVVAALLGRLLINLGKGGTMSLPVIVVGLSVVAVSGAAVALVCGRVAAGQAAAWRPRAD